MYINIYINMMLASCQVDNECLIKRYCSWFSYIFSVVLSTLAVFCKVYYILNIHDWLSIEIPWPKIQHQVSGMRNSPWIKQIGMWPQIHFFFATASLKSRYQMWQKCCRRAVLNRGQTQESVSCSFFSPSSKQAVAVTWSK